MSCTLRELSTLGERKPGKGDEVEASHGLRQVLIIFRQEPEAGGPGKSALNDPSSGQEDEAKLDHQLNTLLVGSLSRFFSGVP